MEWILLVVGLAVGYAIGHAHRGLMAQERVFELSETLVHMLERAHGASPGRTRQAAPHGDFGSQASGDPLAQRAIDSTAPVDDSVERLPVVRPLKVSREAQPELEIHPPNPKPLAMSDDDQPTEPVTPDEGETPADALGSSTATSDEPSPEVADVLMEEPREDTQGPMPDPPAGEADDSAGLDAAPPAWSTAVDPWTGTEVASEAVVDGSADDDEGEHVDWARAAVTTAQPRLGPSTEHTESDDLTKIKGIGPKIAEFLKDSGVTSFTELAAADAAALQELLARGGQGFGLADPRTWPLQAALAGEQRWLALRAVQAAGNEYDQDEFTSPPPVPGTLTDAGAEASPADAG